jgi:Uma2 family endonuclease
MIAAQDMSPPIAAPAAGAGAAVLPARDLDDVSPSILLREVSWETYQTLRNEEANNHVRMIYDRGDLELMSPMKKHGKVTRLLDLMIYEWTQLHGIEVESGGNMTCDREDLKKGLEPDLCYWIAHQELVRDKDKIDFLVDPPPDLALEIEVSRSAIPKLPIYQALRIPEVWRWRGKVEVLVLDDSDTYTVRSESVALPGFPIQLAESFLERRKKIGDNSLMVQFKAAIVSLKSR